MAWRHKRTVDTSTSIPLRRLAKPEEISSYVKKIINSAQYDFYESEAFEVTKVYLNNPHRAYGAVDGVFINESTQSILGDLVLPLMPNVTNIPLIGEHVVVVEYNEQHYYTSIINRKNSPNENSIPGTQVGHKINTKYGDIFERRDIRRIRVNEGEIVYEGRFGNSIKLGYNPQSTNKKGTKKTFAPCIKLRVGQTLTKSDNQRYGKPVRENIELDGSSIYLLEDGLPYSHRSKTEMFEGEIVKGQKVLIRSDGIFISGRTEFRLQVGSFIMIDAPNFSVKDDEVNLGSRQPIDTQPVVKGDDLKEFLDELLSDLDLAFATAMATITPAGVIVTGGMAAPAPYKASIQAIKAKLKAKLVANKILSTKVRTT